MSEMVERVAKAIHSSDYSDLQSAEFCDSSWSMESTREVYIAHARAAIEAMRDPTKGMVDAVNAWCALVDLPKAGPCTVALLQSALVNAALGEDR